MWNEDTFLLGFVLAKDSISMLKSMEAHFHCGIKKLNKLQLFISQLWLSFFRFIFIYLFIYCNSGVYILQL